MGWLIAYLTVFCIGAVLLGFIKEADERDFILLSLWPIVFTVFGLAALAFVFSFVGDYAREWYRRDND